MSKGEGAEYRAQPDALPATPRAMTYAGLARMLLDSAAQRRYLRQTVGVSR